MITPTQKAYALLWRSTAPCPYAQRARRELLATLSREEKIEAIKWLQNNVPPVSDGEMMKNST